jgi:hypothetical protein
MTDTMIQQNIDLSSSGILYNERKRCYMKQKWKIKYNKLCNRYTVHIK